MEVDWEERLRCAKESFVSMMSTKCTKQETHDWYLRRQYERIRLIRQLMSEATSMEKSGLQKEKPPGG
jgi:hypothetical protein